MTKSLSQELCELVGIEPVCTHKYICSCPAPCPKEKCKNWGYPDFENNAENFVKLLELIATIENYDVSFSMALNPITSSYMQSVIINDDCGNVGCSNKTFKKGFIEALCNLAKDNEDVKSYIRDTEWKY